MINHLYQGFKIAFSMYSKIPMPKSEWTEENMRYAMCFFPTVGIVIGGLTLVWRYLSEALSLGGTAFSAIILLLIPVMVSGGIHVDGLLDTADALSSYQSEEKRLEILKDPRTGAFGVIFAVLYFLLYFGIYSLADSRMGLEAEKLWQAIAVSFVISRLLSGYAIVAFQKAKNTGLAAAFSDGAKKRAVKLVMSFYMAAAVLVLCRISIPYAICILAAASFVFAVYRTMSYRKFGGITGDLAGWFLQNCELAMAFAVTGAYWFLHVI